MWKIQPGNSTCSYPSAFKCSCSSVCTHDSWIPPGYLTTTTDHECPTLDEKPCVEGTTYVPYPGCAMKQIPKQDLRGKHYPSPKVEAMLGGEGQRPQLGTIYCLFLIHSLEK